MCVWVLFLTAPLNSLFRKFIFQKDHLDSLHVVVALHSTYDKDDKVSAQSAGQGQVTESEGAERVREGSWAKKHPKAGLTRGKGGARVF